MHMGTGNRESRTMRRATVVFIAAIAAAFVSTTSAVAQTVAITGGKVYPVSGPPIENGTVLVRDGKIVAVGANVAVPNDATRIDATGKWVTPGLIDALTGLGVTEVGAVPNTVDRTARGDSGIAAAFPVWEGINPASTMFAPARNEGITSVVVVPTGGLIAGQAALIDLVPGTVTDMINKAPVAMIAQFGDPRSGGSSARGEQYVRLKELIEDARTYSRGGPNSIARRPGRLRRGVRTASAHPSRRRSVATHGQRRSGQRHRGGAATGARGERQGHHRRRRRVVGGGGQARRGERSGRGRVHGQHPRVVRRVRLASGNSRAAAAGPREGGADRERQRWRRGVQRSQPEVRRRRRS